MPTYDYRCDACEHRFELFQSIKASPVRKCPKCGKLKARRLFGIGAAVIFKGSGFYCTDYRDKSYQAAAKKDKPESSSGGDKTATADKPAATSGKSSGEKSSSSKSDSSTAKTGKK
jgi:putative FmdB family regulatory protein